MLKVSCSELIAIKVKERDFTCVIYIYTCVIYIQFTHDIYTPVIYTLHLCDIETCVIYRVTWYHSHVCELKYQHFLLHSWSYYIVLYTFKLASIFVST